MKISHLYALFIAATSFCAVQESVASPHPVNLNGYSQTFDVALLDSALKAGASMIASKLQDRGDDVRTEVDQAMWDRSDARYPASFDAAKRHVYRIYSDNEVDQYCGCSYTRRGSGASTDLNSCGYEIRRNETRANRIEIEHTVPAENLGRQFSCWREGGRDHCNKTDPSFRNAHNDLHNLMPVIGEVNADRSNYRFDMISGPSRDYGLCEFKVDRENRRAEPADHMKGDIARIHFYMRDQHGLKLSAQQERMFGIWHRSDPVDTWEIVRDERINAIQGNSNPWVTGTPDSSF